MFRQFQIPPLLSLTIFFSIGIALGFYFKNLWLAYLIIPLIIAQLTVFYFRKKLKFYTQIFYAFTSLIFIIFGINSIQQQHENINQAHLGKQLYIEGKITKVLKPNAFQNRYEIIIEKLNNSLINRKLIFREDKKSSNIYAENDKLILYGIISELPKNYTFGGFDYTNYLNKKGIKYQLFLTKLIRQKSTNTFFDKILNFKKSLISFINQSTLNSNSKSIIQALLLGERTVLDDQVKDSFSKTGIIHILAISGLHIGLISGMLLWLLSPLKRIKRFEYIPYIIAIVVLWLYALMVGFSPSVVRAVTMFSFINLGLMINRQSTIINTISGSMILLLLFNPYYLFDVGFQLSYAAVFAIVLFYPVFKRWYYPQSKIVIFFYDILIVSLAAQLGVLPLSLYYFHQLPGLFLLANLVAIPFLMLLLILGFLFVFLGLLTKEWEWLSNLLNKVIDFLIDYVSFLSSYDQFLWKNIYLSTVSLFLSMLLMLGLYAFLYSKKIKFLKIAFILIITLQSVFLVEKYWLYTKDYFIISQKDEELAVFQYHDKQWTMYATKPENFSQEKTSLMASKHIAHIQELPFRNFYTHKNQKVFVVNQSQLDLNLFSADVIIICKGSYYNHDRFLTSKLPQTVVLPQTRYFHIKSKNEINFSMVNKKLVWFDRAIALQ